MNIKKILKLFIFTEWILIAVGIFLTFYLEKTLPLELQEYLNEYYENGFNLKDGIASVLLILIFLLNFISSVGLWKLKIWSKNLYVISTFGISISMIFLGPTVETGIVTGIGELSIIIAGIIIGILYFSELKLDFKKENEFLSQSIKESSNTYD